MVTPALIEVREEPAIPGWGTQAGDAVADNEVVTVFYWTMAVLIVGTFVPFAMYLMLFAMTGEQVCLQRARMFWNVTRVLALVGVNLLIWGHIVAGLWQVWFG